METTKMLSEIEVRIMIKNMISEDYTSTSTMAPTPNLSNTYYNTKEPEKKDLSYKYNKKSKEINQKETIKEKAKRFDIPFSPILKEFSKEDFELAAQVAKKFRESGDINIEYMSGWNGPLLSYLIEFLGFEAKNGSSKAATKLERIFNPLQVKDMRDNLIKFYNQTDYANINHTIIENPDSKEVYNALEKLMEYRVAIKLTSDYNKFSEGEKEDFLLGYILKYMQLRFFMYYNTSLNQVILKDKPKKELANTHRNNYSISDIQKYLYAGNDQDSINDNFKKFNQANQEIVTTLKKNKINPKQIAVIDGMVNSKLDSEEMLEVYPKIFGDVKEVARIFSQTVKGKIGTYMDDVYKKYNLELPLVSTWSSKDIASSQDPTTKLKDDKMGHIFNEMKKIIKEGLKGKKWII